MSSTPKVILVTGANRGIGLAIIQSLTIHPSTKDAILLMGCRDIQKGHAAIASIQEHRPNTTIHLLTLDVTSDDSIRTAVSKVEHEYGRLNVLINNAGFAMIPKEPDFSDIRTAFSNTYNTNVTSVAITTMLFLPLLQKANPGGGKVINISSARGSITRSASGQLPPTASAAYSISKTALNALTVEMSRQEDNKVVEFQLACPGHCRTEFNNYRGTRDPLEGANVVIELVVGERRNLGCWETIGSSRDLIEVPW